MFVPFFFFLPDNHEWDTPHWKGLEARYEHCSFVLESCLQSLWVFGGAQKTGNRNCIQKIQLSGKFCLKFLYIILSCVLLTKLHFTNVCC